MSDELFDVKIVLMLGLRPRYLGKETCMVFDLSSSVIYLASPHLDLSLVLLNLTYRRFLVLF